MAITIENGQVIIRFAYSAAMVAAIRQALPDAKFYSTPAAHWRVSADSIQQAVAFGQAHGILISDTAKALARATTADTRRGAQIAERAAQAIDLTAPLPSGRQLFEHQRAGVARLIAQAKIILADEMGLGKTTTALVAAKAFQLAHGWRVVVVAPVSLRQNWYTEAEGVGVQIEVHSWAKVPPPPEADFVLIADEAHYAQTLRSQRTKGFLALAGRARCVYALTGTPMKNGRPVNLYPLLLAIGHPIAKDRRAYEQRYCDARKTRFSQWDTSGASNLDELREKARDGVLRRTKAQCLDLPAKTRIFRECEPSPNELIAYRETVAAKRAEIDIKISRGDLPTEAEALVMLTAIRQAASLVKVQTALEIAMDIIEARGSVVIFCEFLKTVELISYKLKGFNIPTRTLTGETKPLERADIVDLFQSGQIGAMVGTIKAGGVGLTLTRASNVILVDRAWTPGDNFQAEDRLHRISQHWPVTAHWLQFGETDKEIDALIVGKQRRIDQVLEGERKTMRGVSTSLERYARKLLEIEMKRR